MKRGLLAVAGALWASAAAIPAQDVMNSNWSSRVPAVPSLAPPASRAEWETRRMQIRAQLWELLGRLPPRSVTPRVRLLREEQRDGYRLEKFVFDNGASAQVPGYILLPTGLAEKAPAILYCHWHGGDYPVGKEELFGREHLPVEPGPVLARRGYVVLGIDAPGFGERRGQGPGGPEEQGGAEELSASKFYLWVGSTLWGMMLRDDLLALNCLLARPEVDASRIGVTGISMGATRTWWLMALDDRLRAGVAVGCLTRYQDLLAQRGLRHHGIYYFVPGMLNHFDTETVVALIAPRPILFQTGDQDPGSPPEGVRRIEASVQPVYELYGAAPHFVSRLYPGVGHVYTDEMWRRTVEWLDRHLR